MQDLVVGRPRPDSAGGPVPGWTFAHSRTQLRAGLDATQDAFPGWLEGLSRRLGEVQFFATDRVTEYHAWARAQDGRLLRAYCYLGQRGDVMLFVGSPTTDEDELGVGTRPTDPDCDRWTDDDWTDDDWAARFDTTPTEAPTPDPEADG